MTQVVNIRKKNGQKRQSYDVLIDRRTEFGNPHPIGQCDLCNRVHDRNEAVEMYKRDFYLCLTDSEFRDKVLKLKNKILACWCKPLKCHGDVIVEYLENER